MGFSLWRNGVRFAGSLHFLLFIGIENGSTSMHRIGARRFRKDAQERLRLSIAIIIPNPPIRVTIDVPP